MPAVEYTTIRINTPQNVPIDYELASVGERLLARLVDYLLLIAFVFFTFKLLGIFDLGWDGTLIFFFMVLNWLFIPVIEIYNNGRSPGKVLLNLKVMKIDGSQPGVGSYLLRAFLEPVDMMPFMGLTGILFMSLTKSSQRLGDLAAGTTVIRLKFRAKFEDTIFKSLDEKYVPTYPEVVKLKDRDAGIIHEILTSGNYKLKAQKMPKLAKRVKDVLQVESYKSDEVFLTIVMNDYNHLTQRDLG